MSNTAPPSASQAALRAAVLRQAAHLAKPGDPPTAVFRRAADLAKDHAEHWEAEATKPPITGDTCPASSFMASHWRMIEKELRALAEEPRA